MQLLDRLLTFRFPSAINDFVFAFLLLMGSKKPILFAIVLGFELLGTE